MFKNHLDRVIDKNTDYFNHLSGNCICGRCICGRHKCPPRNLRMDYKKGAQTTYQKDFVPHRCPHGEIYKPDMWDSFNPKQPMDMNTVYNTDYKEHPFDNSKFDASKRPVTSYIPFSGVTAYNVFLL